MNGLYSPPSLHSFHIYNTLGWIWQTFFSRKFDELVNTSGAMVNLCTVEIDRYYPPSAEMDVGLCFVLSLPSVRQIMLRPSGYDEKPIMLERVLKQFSTISAPVVLTNESKIPAVFVLSPFAL